MVDDLFLLMQNQLAKDKKQNDLAFFTPPPYVKPDDLPIQTDEGIFNDTEFSEILRPKKLIFEDFFDHDSAAQENENEVKRKRKREHHSNTIDYNEILISKKYKLETWLDFRCIYDSYSLSIMPIETFIYTFDFFISESNSESNSF